MKFPLFVSLFFLAGGGGICGGLICDRVGPGLCSVYTVCTASVFFDKTLTLKVHLPTRIIMGGFRGGAEGGTTGDPLPPEFHKVSLTVCWYPLIHLGGERHCESKVSFPRTQHNDPARARTRTSRSGIQSANH